MSLSKKYRKTRCILSFPKSGRTWINAFMITYERLTNIKTRVIYKHHVFNNNPMCERLFLVRNPCDILVSLYFQYKYRTRKREIKNVFNGINDIKEFIHSPLGAEDISNVWRGWLNDGVTQYEVRYEDLFNCVWAEILEWFGIKIVEDAIIESDKLCAFDSLKNNLHLFAYKRMFLAMEDGKYTMTPKNNDTHKFRRGLVGGYIDYLSKDNVDYIKQSIPEAARWYSEWCNERV